jgi:hypothetical protein
VGFEPTIAVLERAKTVRALDRTATTIVFSQLMHEYLFCYECEIVYICYLQLDVVRETASGSTVLQEMKALVVHAAASLWRHNATRTLIQYCWDRGFESHLGMDVCVCSVCVLYRI